MPETYQIGAVLCRRHPWLVHRAIDRDNKDRNDDAGRANGERRPQDILMAATRRQARVDGDDAASGEKERNEIENVGGGKVLIESVYAPELPCI